MPRPYTKAQAVVQTNGLTKSAVLFCPASTVLILMKELGPVDVDTEKYLVSLGNELVRICNGKIEPVVDGEPK